MSRTKEIRDRLKELDRERDELKSELREIEEDMKPSTGRTRGDPVVELNM